MTAAVASMLSIVATTLLPLGAGMAFGWARGALAAAAVWTAVLLATGATGGDFWFGLVFGYAYYVLLAGLGAYVRVLVRSRG